MPVSTDTMLIFWKHWMDLGEVWRGFVLFSLLDLLGEDFSSPRVVKEFLVPPVFAEGMKGMMLCLWGKKDHYNFLLYLVCFLIEWLERALGTKWFCSKGKSTGVCAPTHTPCNHASHCCFFFVFPSSLILCYRPSHCSWANRIRTGEKMAPRVKMCSSSLKHLNMRERGSE